MATTTALLQVTDADGLAGWWWEGTYGGMHLERAEAHPASSFDDTQPGTIPVTLGHGGPRLGGVTYLEHNMDGCTDLRAVAVLDDVDPDEIDESLYSSAEIRALMPKGSAVAYRSRLDALALVRETAGVGARPIRIIGAGDYRDQSARATWHKIPAVIQRAAAAGTLEYRWRCPPSLQIHRPPALTAHGEVADRAAYAGVALEYGPPGRVLAVR